MTDARARSLAQQLAREPDAPHAEEHGLILAELERVERQIAALLRFARREELRLEPVDLGEMTRGTLASFQGRFAAAAVDVALDLGEEVVAQADREKLRQVLVNLLENALDALADRPDRRKLTLVVSGQNGTATLHVGDNGPGVAVADLPRLFEPFFSRKATGTGLGLAIARRTVEAHGGRITAESVPGAGTSFAIALPIGARA